MSISEDRREEERRTRASRIKKHLAAAKETVEVEPSTKAEPKAEPKAEHKAAQPLIWPPLQPWEKLDRFGRREQFRPMTSREFDQENDRLFMESQKRQDEAHADRIRRTEQEHETEQQAAQKQAEVETRTGKRPYDPGRYVSLEEARRRGYLDSGEGSSGSQESTPSYNPRDNRGNLMGRFGA